MVMKRSALGRGLDALITMDDLKTGGSSSISEIELSKIQPNPDQPRSVFEEETLEELAVSIRSLGVIQPITLKETGTDKYMIISGERRYRASLMAELLRILPETNPDYAEIMAAYLKMMKTLKETQNEKGMWRQLVDDPELWEETSGSAMFTYAMIVGVKKGWLDAKEYGEVARKGWIALCSYIDKAGDVKAVCEGTMIKNSREHYINRLALTGDLHGQAPVLWCAYALVTDFKTNK